MSTKKHFELAAETIAKITKRGYRLRAASKSIKVFSRENPRFDVKRFLKACDL